MLLLLVHSKINLTLGPYFELSLFFLFYYYEYAQKVEEVLLFLLQFLLQLDLFDKLSVTNSAKALFYFAIGLPAFSLIKVFSAFFFARHNTKVPFYISLTSVLLNVFISVVFFKEIGFIIIPIATTISSWFNAILLLIFLKIKGLFSFNLLFINRFVKILLASILMGIFFNYVIHFFNDQLHYEASFKAIYLIGAVVLGLIFYLLISILIKAFKRSDINLNYQS